MGVEIDEVECMPSINYLEWGTEALSSGIRSGALRSAQLVSEYLAKIEQRNMDLHAFVKTFPQRALDRAHALDKELSEGNWRGPLHGLPVAIKDLADIRGEITGFGSRCYSQAPATRNADFVDALEKAGAIIVGKTHTVEFAFGSWGTNYALGTPINPMLPGQTSPGGSSSGSAVAVAAGMIPLAVGSDTGGSVRIPASLCGVAGMKPSHGLISLEGVAPLSDALDTIGPLAKDIEGLRILLNGLRSRNVSEKQCNRPATIRFVTKAALEPVNDGIRSLYQNFVSRLSKTIEIEEFDLPLGLAEYQARCGQLMAYDAYQALHNILEDHRQPMDPWVRRRILMGREISDADHAETLERRDIDTAAFLESFGPDDVLVLPTTPYPAQPLESIDETQFPMSRFTRLANYLDLTAVTLPFESSLQAPVGIQFIMRRDNDDRLLSFLTDRLN